MTDPLTTVMPRRRPTTYTARPGFQPGPRIPEQPTPNRRELPPPPPAHQTAPNRGYSEVPSPTSHTSQDAVEEPTPTVDITDSANHLDRDRPADQEDRDSRHGDENTQGDIDELKVAEPNTDQVDTDEVDIEPATLVEFLYPPSEDPFDVTMVLGAPDVAVGTRLTPTVLAGLIEQLEWIRDEQRQAMGLTPSAPISQPPPTSPPAADPTDPDENDEDDDHDSISRRAADPLGLRQLRGRSQRTTILIGAGIAVLLMLSLLWNAFAR